MLGIYLSVHRGVPAGQNTVVLGLSASSQVTKPLLSRNSATGSKHMRLRQNDTGGSVQKMCLWQPCCGLVAALLSRRWAHKRIRSIRTWARGRMALLRRRGRHYPHDNIWGGGAGRNGRYFLGLARLACCPLPLLLAEVHTHERHWYHHGAAIWPHRSCPTLSTHGFEAKTKSHFSCRGECGDELNFDELVYLHSIHTAGNILNDPVSTWSCYCVIKILVCHLHLLGAVWSKPLVAKTPHLWEENISPWPQNLLAHAFPSFIVHGMYCSYSSAVCFWFDSDAVFQPPSGSQKFLRLGALQLMSHTLQFEACGTEGLSSLDPSLNSDRCSSWMQRWGVN